MNTQSSTNQPVVLMTLGLPGSGKTFFARKFATDVGLPLIDAERLRHELFEQPNYSQDEDRIVLSLCDYMSEQFLSAGLSIVIDGLNDTRVRRHGLRALARKYKATPLVVWIQTDVNTAFDRATSRDRRNPNDKFARELSENEFESFSTRVKGPQHEDYVVISGKHVFRNQMNVVSRRLKELQAARPATSAKSVSLGGRVDMTRRKAARNRIQ